MRPGPGAAIEEWRDFDDEDVCPVCLELDGQQVEAGQPFFSAIDGAEYFGLPEPHRRCRCGKVVTEFVL